MTATYAPSPTLYLPISEERISPLRAGGSLDDFLEIASIHEQAALMLLLRTGDLARQRASLSKIETLFSSVLKVALEEGLFAFSGVLQARFSAVGLLDGLRHAESLGIGFMEEQDIAKLEFLGLDGQWDFGFSQRYAQSFTREVILSPTSRPRMTDQQGRVFEEFKLFRDESFHLQAYAGSGKTYLLTKFVELLNPPTTLLMAMLPQQVTALKERIQKVSQKSLPPSCTFGYMANMILNRTSINHGWRVVDKERAKQNYRVSDSQICGWLNLQAVGNLTPNQVADACRRTVYSFCHSPANKIGSKHLPALGASFNSTHMAVLLEYSRLMWREIVSPSSREIRLPIRNVHRIKYLSMTNEVIPEEFTHVIIDESHELSAPILQILARSPQAVVTLGDEYQQLAGIGQSHSSGIRQRFATQSIRAGRGMGEVLNPLIGVHPSSVKESFEGRALHPTQIIKCSTMPIPEKPTTILVANEWGLFSWFMRLIDARSAFRIPDSTLQDLKAFVRDLSLLHSEDMRPRHRLIFRYGTWDTLALVMGSSHDFIRVDQWLSKGGNYEDFSTKADLCAGLLTAPLLLARVEDVKNQEFDSVLLSRDLLRPPRQGTSHTLAAVCSLLYTASSRARHELIVPDDMQDFVQGLKVHKLKV